MRKESLIKYWEENNIIQNKELIGVFKDITRSIDISMKYILQYIF